MTLLRIHADVARILKPPFDDGRLVEVELTDEQAAQLAREAAALVGAQPDQGHVLERERDRLRALLDKVHAELHDALNATPLDAPDGTASGFEHELTRRLLQRSLKP
jgi:hypothetical protein